MQVENQVENQAEEVEVEQQLTPDEAQAEEDAGFAASFGTEVRAEEAPAVVETEQVAEAEVEALNVEIEKGLENGLTPAELNALLAKIPRIDEVEQSALSEIRKIHGKIGELVRNQNEFKSRTGTKIDAKNLKRLSGDYPELAEAIASDFSEMFDNSPAPQQVDYSSQIAQVKDEMYKDMQKNLMLIQHHDYLDVIATDDYKVWKQTQSAELQDQLENSYDAMFLGKQLTAFKTWQGAKNKGSINERTEQLKRAVAPKGTQTTQHRAVAMTEEDGFAAAFKT